MSYDIAVEKFTDTYRELEPLYRQHYSEMLDRLKNEGVEDYSPYNPRLFEYGNACDGGWLLTYVVRHEGKVCGYSNVYITNDMHNGDLIAQEDAIFILKEHRNGTNIGKTLIKFIIEDLRNRKIKRMLITTMTDLRVAPLMRRMGFKDIATQMIYKF